MYVPTIKTYPILQNHKINLQQHATRWKIEFQKQALLVVVKFSGFSKLFSRGTITTMEAVNF